MKKQLFLLIQGVLNFKRKIRLIFYRNSIQFHKDQAAFKQKTGYDLDDLIFTKFQWVPPDCSLPNPGRGFYIQNGQKFLAVNGQMVPL